MKIDKDKVLEKCLAHLRDCSADMSVLQVARTNSLKAYMAQPYGNEVAGRSQVVMSDVANTIESIMPTMLRIFAGGAEVVKVSGQGPEDENGAKLMGELVNWQSQKCFNSFLVFYDWFKDAFMYRLGVIKRYWRKETQYKDREYKDLSDAEFEAILAKGNFEVLEHQETIVAEGQIDPLNGEMVVPPVVSHYLKGREVIEISQPMVEVLPPEEFIFDPRCKDLADSFCAHKKRVHKSEMRKYGLKDADIADAVAEMSGENLKQERFRDLGGSNFLIDADDEDFIYIYECYYNQYDKDGKPEPIKAIIMGNRVVEAEANKYGRPPFRALSAIRMTHRVVGRSFADLVDEVQRLKTALVRYILDNIYFQNNGQRVVNPFKINMDDLFTQNVPGGIIRTKDANTPVGDALMPVPVNPLPPWVFTFLEYADGSILENRTGVTRYNQGLDSKTLNKTATGISQIMSASQQRIELIARLFAETGVKGLFEDLIQMNLDFLDSPATIRLNEQWQSISPSDIDGKYDINIDVGIGTGTKEMIVGQLMQMLQLYLQGLSRPMMDPATGAPTFVITPQNVVEIVKAVWENMGFKNSDKYVQDLDAAQPNMMGMGGMNGIPPEIAAGMFGGDPTGGAVQSDPGLPSGSGVFPPGAVPYY